MFGFEIWSWDPEGGSTPRQTGWLTVSSIVTGTWNIRCSVNVKMCLVLKLFPPFCNSPCLVSLTLRYRTSECLKIQDLSFRGYTSNSTWTEINVTFFPWRWGGSSTQAWMPTYVSILRINQMIWVWRATVGMIYGQTKTEELGEKPVPVPLYPPQIPHGLTRARTRASAGRRLTALSMARPKYYILV
jgi:hypothetical protein